MHPSKMDSVLNVSL